MKILAVAALAGAGLASAVLPANASVHHPQLPGLAVTQLSNRLDSGDHVNPDGFSWWATDTIQRDLTITHTGGDNYTAIVTDEGSFKTIPGNLTPGSGTPSILTTSVKMGSSTSITGTAIYSFTADQAPDFSLVPASENGTPAPGSPQTTGFWVEQAFPAGTIFTFAGSSPLTDWSWVYRLKCPLQTVTQTWIDSAAVDSGNILGC